MFMFLSICAGLIDPQQLPAYIPGVPIAPPPPLPPPFPPQWPSYPSRSLAEEAPDADYEAASARGPGQQTVMVEVTPDARGARNRRLLQDATASQQADGPGPLTTDHDGALSARQLASVSSQTYPLTQPVAQQLLRYKTSAFAAQTIPSIVKQAPTQVVYYGFLSSVAAVGFGQVRLHACW
jgi:hypothetical protein